MAEIPLSTIQVVMNAILALMAPVVVVSLARGSPPPRIGVLARFYRAEPLLNVAGDLLVLTLGFQSIMRLAMHFGILDANWRDTLVTPLGLTFAVFSMAFVAIGARSILRVRNGVGPAN